MPISIVDTDTLLSAPSNASAHTLVTLGNFEPHFDGEDEFASLSVLVSINSQATEMTTELKRYLNGSPIRYWRHV